jgi:hypothetical protein
MKFALQGRMFYGWWVVLGLATISAVMTAMGSINLGLFIEPMHDELDSASRCSASRRRRGSSASA